jgi:peptidoglycan/LPS O-acetylase OafA/YrhL
VSSTTTSPVPVAAPRPGGGSQLERVRAATYAVFLPGGTGSDRLALLDTVRALAVLAVVVHHTWFVAGSPLVPVDLGPKTVHLAFAFQGLGLGVDIFFVLSGFLLSMPWHRAAIAGSPQPSLPRYFMRRFLRIVPPYWFMLMVMGLLMAGATIPWSAIGTHDGVKALVAHFFFVQYLFPSTSGGFATVNGSLWTLTIEMLFYITLPLLVLAFVNGRWRIGLPLSIAFSLLWVWLSWHRLDALVNHLLHGVERMGVGEEQIRYFLSTQYLAFIGEFGIGIAVAGWWIRRRGGEQWISPRLRWLAGIGGLLAIPLALAVMYLTGAHGADPAMQVFARMAVAACVGLLIMGLLAGPEPLRRPFTFLPFRLYGVIGYSVFLWHLPLLTAIGAWPILAGVDPTEKLWDLLAIGLPVTAIWGVVMYLLVERPFLASRPGLSKATPAIVAEPPPVNVRPQPAIDPEAW